MNTRKSTKYPGVQARESKDRRFRGRPDVCFTIDYRDATGKRIRKDIGWASEGFTAATAAEIRARYIFEAKSGMRTPDAKKRYPTFAEAYEIYERDWVQAQGKKVKDGTPARQWLSDLTNVPLDQITPRLLDSLMAQLKARGLAPQSVRLAIGLVRRVMRRMLKWGLYDGPMPFDAIALPKLNNKRERFLTPAEARRLLKALHNRSEQVFVMAMVSLFCGLRFGEIARLRWRDIDFDNAAIFVAESKSGHSRHAVMTEDVAKALRELQTGKSSDLVFPARGGGIMAAISSTFERVVDELGLNGTPETGLITDRRQKVVFHTLRHTYASWLAKTGQGQLVIADRLGHRTLAMTQRYTHLMDETRKQSAEAITKLFHGDAPENQQ